MSLGFQGSCKIRENMLMYSENINDISITLENIEKDKKLLAELLIRLRHQSRFIVKRYGKNFKYK